MIKKFTLCLLSASLIIVLAACSPSADQIDGEEVDMTEDEVQSLESAFESVDIVDGDNYVVERKTMHGDIAEIINSSTVLLSGENQLMVYDMETEEVNVIAQQGWNPQVSQNKSIIAYENDNGIYKVSPSGDGEVLVYERESDEIIRSYILSRDGGSILISLIDEDEYKTVLVDSSLNTRVVPFDENEGFVVTRPLYLTRFRLYALAESSEAIQGEEGSVSASSIDFVYVDLSNGRIRNITSNDYGDTVEYVDQSNTGNIILRHIKRSTNEEGLVETKTYRTFNTSTEYIYTSRIKNRDIILFKSINDDRDFITVENPPEPDQRYPKLVELKHYAGSREDTIATIFTGSPSQIYLYEDTIVFNSNGDTYIIDKKN
ncbi:hypothetical protein [Alkalibacter saccharofermentans]|uniref:Uncharacterized protein n=1 Tax=Alkalibacter saccharofermentans DSM 14828 TaxID=1120975 RepID=A0A1M4S7C5_9FIRM|nr:hypothetical protein [Alkalibacter saccharofermentans]SHE28081.1 hypothetical protein SAMN02746064_00130 [Alkalibacter saccharofermentans DSM 14828]